jgi:hypothetical protein
MRNKREVENRGAHRSDDGPAKPDTNGPPVSDGKSVSKSKVQENAGELLVRFVASSDDHLVRYKNERTINPFTDTTWNVPASTDLDKGTPVDPDALTEVDAMVVDNNDFTKFHLEDGEMLMELMIHLHTDCPDLMQNKTQLLEQVSALYDLIKQ